MKAAHNLRRAALLLICALLSAACGGGGPAATPTQKPPTPTPFPTFAFVEPTKAPVFEQDATAEAPEAADADEIELDPVKVERGLGRYEALECGACHGLAGIGADGAKALLDFAMSEDEFITFVRSGGALGTDHQYSTDRLSNSGSRNLYQYLLSLAQAG